MAYQKFDVAKLERLNDTARFETMRPDVMWDAVGVSDAEVIVEIGAGTGLFAAEFAARVPGATVFAVDTEQAMLDWMSEHRPEVGAGRVVPVLSAEGAVPLEDGIADVVAMINVHHELAEPEAIYAEALRLLRTGGRVLVVDWAPFETPKGPSLDVRAQQGEIVEHLRRAGFSQPREHEGALVWHSLVTAVREA